MINVKRLEWFKNGGGEEDFRTNKDYIAMCSNKKDGKIMRSNTEYSVELIPALIRAYVGFEIITKTSYYVNKLGYVEYMYIEGTEDNEQCKSCLMIDLKDFTVIGDIKQFYDVEPTEIFVNTESMRDSLHYDIDSLYSPTIINNIGDGNISIENVPLDEFRKIYNKNKMLGMFCDILIATLHAMGVYNENDLSYSCSMNCNDSNDISLSCDTSILNTNVAKIEIKISRYIDLNFNTCDILLLDKENNIIDSNNLSDIILQLELNRYAFIYDLED